MKIGPQITAIVSSGYTVGLSVLEYEKYGFKGTLTEPYATENLKITCIACWAVRVNYCLSLDYLVCCLYSVFCQRRHR